MIAWGANAPAIPSAFARNINELRANDSHLVLLRGDGKVWSNLFAITSPAMVRHIAAGPDFAITLRDDGLVQVWGNLNDEGLLTPPNLASGVVEIAADRYHALALHGDGRVVAWCAEQHDSGQADVPYLAQSRVVAIAAGDQSSIALRDDGTLVAWGNVPLSHATIGMLYNNTNPSNVVLTATTNATLTKLPTFTVTLTATRTATWQTKTRIPATLTMVIAYLPGTNTLTPSLTPSKTLTPSRTLTPSKTLTAIR